MPNGSFILNRYLYLSDGWLGLDVRAYKKEGIMCLEGIELRAINLLNFLSIIVT